MKALLAIVFGTLIIAGANPGPARAADKTCAAGASSCVRDRIREHCVLLNPPFATNKVSRWRCPDPHP
jgi:hypothetical protein